MRRRTTPQFRPYRQYDFYSDVAPQRLQAIGAISLAWNWLEGAVDTALCTALELHPDLWLELTGRINGMDAKLGIIRESLRLNCEGSMSAGWLLMMRRALNAIESHKKLRDGVIHVRLLDPQAAVADTPARKGYLDEVLVSQEALDGLYQRLKLLAMEANSLSGFFANLWLASNAEEQETRLQAADTIRREMARLQDLQTERESLPPLPEFPEPPQAQPSSEGHQEPLS